MSSILKQPLVSPSSHVVTINTKIESSSRSKPARAEEETKAKETDQAQVIQIMKANLLAETEYKIAMLKQEAQKKAENIIDTALTRAEQLKKEAEHKGYQEGYQAGYAAGQKEAEQLLTKAQTVLQEAKEEKRKLLVQVEPEALALAFHLAEKIIRHELAEAPETLAELLKASARKFPKGEPVVLEVAPGERERWQEAKDILLEAMPQRPFKIVENSSVPPAEFILSSALGTVDARIDPQLEVLRTNILGDDG